MAERFTVDPLPWCPHGPHHLAILDPGPDSDGTRFLATPARFGRWSLTIRPPGATPAVAVRDASLDGLLDAARRFAADLGRVAS